MNRILALALLAAAAPAFSQKVVHDWVKEFDFSQLKTYAWREHPMAKDDAFLKTKPVGVEIMKSAVNDILINRGYVPIDVGEPDFYVTFFATRTDYEYVSAVISGSYVQGITPGSPANAWYSSGPVWMTSGAKTLTKHAADGMLMLDIVDGDKKLLIWRAYCTDTIKNMAQRHKNIDGAVKKALAKFPPKK
jgi:hypothetical protein